MDPTFIFDIPGIVEGFVKTCRTVKDFEGIEEKHQETIENAIYYSQRLDYYANFVDLPSSQLQKDSWTSLDQGHGSDQTANAGSSGRGDRNAIYEGSQDLLCDLFQKSLTSLRAAQVIIDEWAVRLDINTGIDGRIAKLALSVSDHFVQRSRYYGKKRAKTALIKFRAKTEFLILGSQQIDSSMDRLKQWLAELHFILMASPVLRRRLAPAKLGQNEPGNEPYDDILFVAMAHERDNSSQTMETVNPELISVLRPLDDRKAHNFMLVDSKDGPYSDCIVDRRNVHHLIHNRRKLGDQALRDTERIARLFAEEKDELGRVVSASVGVLPCCGFARPIPEYHDLVFRLPTGIHHPRTLRSLLLGSPRHSLNARLEFATKLATAVLIVHSLNLVHKDIRPDSIIVIESISDMSRRTNATQTLGEPYLVAFNESRSLDSVTAPLASYQTAERRWASLYQHPRHLRSSVHLPFEMRDDIYSLGICLLEVALWSSLFVWDGEQRAYVNDTSICDLSEERYDRMLEEMGEDSNRSQAWFRQMDLVQLAEEKVAIAMGDAFKDVVVECLTFGTGKRSMAEVLKGKELGLAHMKNQSIEFIKKILSRLRSLKLS